MAAVSRLGDKNYTQPFKTVSAGVCENVKEWEKFKKNIWLNEIFQAKKLIYDIIRPKYLILFKKFISTKTQDIIAKN